MSSTTNQFSKPIIQLHRAGDRGAASDSKKTAPTQMSGGAGSQVDATTQISAFLCMVNDAAARVAARDSSTTRSGLAAIARSSLDQFTGQNYLGNKAAHDAELPKSSDPRRLALARQATDYGNNKAINPFRGMSRDQLALISYDDSGAFTVNERRAAWSEAYRQTRVWKEAVVEKIMDEYRRTAKISADTYQEILDHYRSLPAIEQAQLPNGHEAQLQARILNVDSVHSLQLDTDFGFLLELLAKRLEQATPT